MSNTTPIALQDLINDSNMQIIRLQLTTHAYNTLKSRGEIQPRGAQVFGPTTPFANELFVYKSNEVQRECDITASTSNTAIVRDRRNISEELIINITI